MSDAVLALWLWFVCAVVALVIVAIARGGHPRSRREF